MVFCRTFLFSIIFTFILSSIVFSEPIILECDGESHIKNGKKITIVVDGTELVSDVMPVILNGRTLVPLRALFEYTGADVDWNDEEKSVKIISNGTEILLKINDVKTLVNGNEVLLDVPAKIIDSRTMVPLRFISEQLNMKVGWDPEKYVVSIDTSKIKEISYITKDNNDYYVISVDYFSNFNVFALKEPDRIVFDIPNVTGPEKTQKIEVGNEKIISIRYANFEDEDKPYNVARIVFDLEYELELNFENTNNYIVVYEDNENSDSTIKEGLEFIRKTYATNGEEDIEEKHAENVPESTNGQLPAEEKITGTPEPGSDQNQENSNQQENQNGTDNPTIVDSNITSEEENSDSMQNQNINEQSVDNDSTNVDHTEGKIDYPVENVDHTVGKVDYPVENGKVDYPVESESLSDDKDLPDNEPKYNVEKWIEYENKIADDESDGRLIENTEEVQSQEDVEDKNVEDKIASRGGIDRKQIYLRNMAYYNTGDRVYLSIKGADLMHIDEDRNVVKHYEEAYDQSKKIYNITFDSELADIDEGQINIDDSYLDVIKVEKINEGEKTRIVFLAKDEFKYLTVTRGIEYVNDTAITILKPYSQKDKLVVIDPGHGGGEPGAVVGDLEEKELNLDISIRLNELLKQNNVNTYMIREDDRYVGLYERAYIANELNATLFLSIHNNAYYSSVHGTETLYYPLSSYYNSFAGKDFAQIVQTHLVNALGTKDRGLVERPKVVVIRETMMPAALAEIAFMTNSGDRSKLIDPEFRQKSAQALCDAILESLKLAN